MFRPAAIAAVLGLAAAPVSTATTPSPSEVAAAERAFAAAAKAEGVRAAFLGSVADDAVSLTPAPVSARAELEKQPDRKGPPYLEWWPIWAGVARSGDLGFTTGPYIFGETKGYGYYFTVWRRQADGSWKWVLDQGARLKARPRAADARDAATTYLPVSQAGAVPAGVALAAVQALDTELNQRLIAGDTAAYAALIADDARAMGLGASDYVAGRTAVLETVKARPRLAELALLGGSTSEAGDLAYTFGKASWSADGRAVAGAYVRVWQRSADGWRLVFDEVVEV